jgi:hypothetical protein
MLMWDREGFDKKHVRTRYAELVFLHSLGSTGHMRHSGASGMRNINALFFMLWWDRYRFDKKRPGTYYAELVFLHSMGYVGHIMHSCAFRARNIGALFFIVGWDRCGFDTSASGHVTLNLCFLSGGIYGARSAFHGVRGAKRRRTIIHARVGPVWIQKNMHRDTLR